LSNASTRRAICGEASCALGGTVAPGDRNRGSWPGEAPAVEAAAADATAAKNNSTAGYNENVAGRFMEAWQARGMIKV